jgi:hypothetical protein
MTETHVTARELVATVRRIANATFCHKDRIHLFLAAAELERLSYPEFYGRGTKTERISSSKPAPSNTPKEIPPC